MDSFSSTRLRDLGLTVGTDVVDQGLEVLKNRGHLAPLWRGRRRPDRSREPPLCGKGTVYKIKRLYQSGKLPLDVSSEVKKSTPQGTGATAAGHSVEASPRAVSPLSLVDHGKIQIDLVRHRIDLRERAEAYRDKVLEDTAVRLPAPSFIVPRLFSKEMNLPGNGLDRDPYWPALNEHLAKCRPWGMLLERGRLWKEYLAACDEAVEDVGLRIICNSDLLKRLRVPSEAIADWEPSAIEAVLGRALFAMEEFTMEEFPDALGSMRSDLRRPFPVSVDLQSGIADDGQYRVTRVTKPPSIARGAALEEMIGFAGADALVSPAWAKVVDMLVRLREAVVKSSSLAGDLRSDRLSAIINSESCVDCRTGQS